MAVPLHTESRILMLYSEAIAAKDDSDLERIFAELRLALTEHIRYAKSSLRAQAAAIAAVSKAQETP